MAPQDPMHLRGENKPRGNVAAPDAPVAEDAAADDDFDSDRLFGGPRPAGERERFDDGRALRESQARAFAERGDGFLVEFARMKGPPQICGLMVLLAIGLGCTIGVVPAVMGDRFARLRHGYTGVADCGAFATADKPDECFAGGADAQAAASVSSLIQNGITFLTASLTGSLSDEHGRKGPLLVGLVLALIPAGVLCVLQEVPGMSPWWYYATTSASGLISWVAIALSALNDVLPKELRAPGVGLLFAGMLLGMCLSPTLALFLSRRALTLVSFSVVALGAVATLWMVPETVRPVEKATAAKRRTDREALEVARDQRLAEESGTSGLRRFYYGSSVCRTIRRLVVRPVWEMSILNRNSFFRLIGSLAFFTGMVTSGDQVLIIYYLEDQLAFDAKDVSLMFLTIGATGILSQVLVMNPLNAAVGEKMVLVTAFASGMVANFLYGTARRKAVVFGGLLVAGFSTMAFPTVSAIKANNVGASEQGRIQGALYSVKALAGGVGPALMQIVYSKTKDAPRRFPIGGPGTMFEFASGLFAIAIVLTLLLPNDKANSNHRHGGRPLIEEGEEESRPVIDDVALGEYRRLVTEDDENANANANDDGGNDSDYGSV